MKKRKTKNQIAEIPTLNPVAKFAHRFNRAKAFSDKNDYKRKAKHVKQEDFPFALA